MLTGKSRWRKGSFLTGGDKELLLKQVKLVRDSPTEVIYLERENKLLEMTQDLLVKAGQSLNKVPFSDYYAKCWKVCSFRWILAFRRNLPTKGCNDTQVRLKLSIALSATGGRTFPKPGEGLIL